jgi:hypothetical protein
LAAVFVAVAAQAPAGLTLGAIEVIGTKRYTSDELLRPIDLSLGQPITVEDLARAAERLRRARG